MSLDESVWRIRGDLFFRIIDVSELADSVEALIDERAYRLDSFPDDPRGDLFLTGEERLHDATDPVEVLQVAFLCFLPSWAGLEGDCDAGATGVDGETSVYHVQLETFEASVADADKFRDWIDDDVTSSWINQHFKRFVGELRGVVLERSQIDFAPLEDD